ncbi:GIY-YIG nuclease family protein [Pseudanabaena sp. BC1403]|uniref:GIY-YIG nuclease family protein n=1 Tax=Pseudanabaena sp. BC1403 TaxID=2043171 RepID=UPI000CD9360A|nr:GIY-YIG nuclease family protein [Pseudanabaena sp. BC1403]
MVRGSKSVVFIERSPSDPDKGWGWVEVELGDIRRFKIDTKRPSSRYITKRKLRYDFETNSIQEYDEPYVVSPPSRGKAGGKKFTLNINGELLTINAQKFLTIEAICAWVKTWADPKTKIVTSGSRAHSLDGDKLAHQAHFVYFIFNQDSNAIKIGRAKNIQKRMQSLQTSSPSQLKLIKFLQVEGAKEAQELEQSLHKQFWGIRLAGEWFKAEVHLLEYISQL